MEKEKTLQKRQIIEDFVKINNIGWTIGELSRELKIPYGTTEGLITFSDKFYQDDDDRIYYADWIFN